MDVILFTFFALVAIVGAVSLVLQKHPISSALSLVSVMVALAVLFLLLGAEFIAAAQLVVYSGAIMVLFVFVIMLLNAGAERESRKGGLAQFLGLPLTAILLVFASSVITQSMSNAKAVKFGAFAGGGPREVGWELFTRYLLPFEVTSILILIAIAGAVVLARKEID
ncbi:MAG: NADH-quinone oxidoreductase subunit J [Acidobacteria bacterium]|jgi:NADH-quinone oxidoreductase subunit J|nr:NADH-quinone oxidoreductase subunit J [Acidobacteriota bacterium]